MISKQVGKKTNRGQAERARLRKLRDRFQKERPGLEELLATGKYTPPVPQGEYVMMLELAAELKRARIARRLSLADVAKRSGIDKAALSRIETGRNINPTISTLEIIARSIGAQLQFQLIIAK